MQESSYSKTLNLNQSVGVIRTSPSSFSKNPISCCFKLNSSARHRWISAHIYIPEIFWNSPAASWFPTTCCNLFETVMTLNGYGIFLWKSKTFGSPRHTDMQSVRIYPMYNSSSSLKPFLHIYQHNVSHFKLILFRLLHQTFLFSSAPCCKYAKVTSHCL